MFGQFPLFYPSGLRYDFALDYPEALVLWEAPANQEYLISQGGRGRLDYFIMVIDARTPVALLRKMYSGWQSELGWLNYHEGINRVGEWIEQLGWAYIPLSDELNYVMFVSGTGEKARVEAVELMLANIGAGCSRVR